MQCKGMESRITHLGTTMCCYIYITNYLCFISIYVYFMRHHFFSRNLKIFFDSISTFSQNSFMENAIILRNKHTHNIFVRHLDKIYVTLIVSDNYQLFTVVRAQIFLIVSFETESFSIHMIKLLDNDIIIIHLQGHT